MVMIIRCCINFFKEVLQSPSHFGEIVVDIKSGLCYFATNWYSFAM